MPLPDFNDQGDLPVGVHLVTFEDVISRFGQGSPQRELVTNKLQKIYSLVKATKHVIRFVIFGSYITNKLTPNDVDILLIVDEHFSLEECEKQSNPLFYHDQAQQVFGASIFWISNAVILLESLEDFIGYWQIKRDRNQRGIVEVKL